jgi:tRNA(His) 5'-end guanylyltransferase
MSNNKNSLNKRMKNNYENRSKTYLVRRQPVVLRLDGKAFHTLTRGFKRPYDEVFRNAMNATTKYLCENIQGCKLGYTQSDEITLLLTDYDTLTTDAWFDYAVQKMCSIAASMATLEFNRQFAKLVKEWLPVDEADEDIFIAYSKAIEKGAMFDARCFSIPEDEVTNCFLWRQQDCTRNAIQMLGQCYFSDKQLKGESNNDIQDMLMLQKGINFNDMPTAFKRGVCCKKDEGGKWLIDTEIPIFSKDREYIENTFRNKTEEN